MDNQMTEKENESLNKLSKLISEIEYAMLTTLTEDGKVHSRPMLARQFDQEGNIWLLSGKRTKKTSEIMHNSAVNLSFASPQKNCFVSVSGKGHVIEDRNKAEELWNPAFRAWFPKGLDDPDLVLLKVAAEEAEYWDSPTSSVVHLVGLVKVALTGKKYEPSEKEHKKMDLAS